VSKAVFDIKKLRGLDRRDLVVLKELAIFADKDNRAWPRNKVIADKTGYSVRSVQSALQILQALGLIKVSYSGRLLANGAFEVDKRYIDLLMENWKKFMLDEKQAANDSNIIELTIEEIQSRRIRIVGRTPNH
jgi:hypothetical protein